MHAPGYDNAQQSSVPDRPEAPNCQHQTTTEQPQQTTIVDEKTQRFQEDTKYPNFPPPEQHPANYAPFADDIAPQHAQVPQYSYDRPPPGSPGPLPAKVNPDREESRPDHPVAVAPDVNPLHSPRLPRSPPQPQHRLRTRPRMTP